MTDSSGAFKEVSASPSSSTQADVADEAAKGAEHRHSSSDDGEHGRTSSERPRQGATESYAYEYLNRCETVKRLSISSLSRWLLTVLLAIAIYAVLWGYSVRGPMQSGNKKAFNALIIGFSIALGLNINSALKSNAGHLRWWLLSLRPLSARETDLVMQTDNLTRMILLGWTSKYWLIHLFVFLWLLLNMASQVAIAALGLTYSINPSTDQAVMKPGTVLAPDLTDLKTAWNITPSSSPQSVNSMRYSANTYGIVSQMLGPGTLDEIPPVGTIFLTSAFNLTYCDPVKPLCRFYFYDTSPPSAEYQATVMTNRSVSSTANCRSWRVLSGGDGTSTNITIDDGTRSDVGPLPALNGPGQTLFMNDPQDPSGPRWATVLALEASATKPWFYSCNVSFMPVVNAQVPQHQLGQNLSRMAAAAIALQGYGASTGDVNSTTRFQFQSYPAQSTFGLPADGNVDTMGRTMALFALGVVAAVSIFDTSVPSPGMEPVRSVVLEIPDWAYIHLILCLTVGLQLLLTAGTVIVGSRVQVRGHSRLATTTLLRPVVRGLGDEAGWANGEQIAKMLGSKTKLLYAPNDRGGYHMRVLEH